MRVKEWAGGSGGEERRGSEMIIRRDVFVFKQKTADEVRLSLVGSGMCIRDSF